MNAKKRTRTLQNTNDMDNSSSMHGSDKVRRIETPLNANVSSSDGAMGEPKMNSHNLSSPSDETEPYNLTGVNFMPYATLTNRHTKAVLDEVDRVIALMEASTDAIPPATNVAVNVDEALLAVMERPDPNDRHQRDMGSMDGCVPSGSQTSNANTPQETANNSFINQIDESIIEVDEYIPKRNHDEDEVIFVGETPGRQRITAVVDLCASDTDTPEKSTRRNRTQTETQSQPTAAPSSPKQTQPAVREPHRILCPVCLDEFPLNHIWTTFCGHGFCEPCLRKCVQTHKRCPKCNAKCNLKQIHRLFIQ